MKILDLYSGLGGASEAFVEAGHDVVRIDNNPAMCHVPHTRIADSSFAYNFIAQEKFDLIWASPPCREFSNGFNAPKPTAAREGRDFTPDINDLTKAMNIIGWLEPKYWIIENVVGAIKDFEPYLGEPKQIIGSFVLWGHFPQLIVPRDWVHTKTSQDPGSNDPLRSNKRAKIPIEISTATMQAISTPTLGDYL